MNIFLSPYALTGTVETRKNPFTGETRDWFGRHPQSNAQLGATFGVLQRFHARPSGDPDFADDQLVSLGDGSAVAIFVNRNGHGGNLSFEGDLTTAIGDFLFEVMVAGKLMVTGVEAQPVFIVTSSDLLPGVPASSAPATVADSASALVAALAPSVKRARES
jgi:hypothetical protein